MLAVLGSGWWTVHHLRDHGYFVRWAGDFDRAGYARVRRTIEADRLHEGGWPFEEVRRQLGLDAVPWDDASFQQEPGTYRIYHFRGFALHAYLRSLPAGLTPAAPFGAGAWRHGPGRLWLLHRYSSVEVDGLDRKERMRRYWKEIEEECERINAEIERDRRATPAPESRGPR